MGDSESLYLIFLICSGLLLWPWWHCAERLPWVLQEGLWGGTWTCREADEVPEQEGWSHCAATHPSMSYPMNKYIFIPWCDHHSLFVVLAIVEAWEGWVGNWTGGHEGCPVPGEECQPGSAGSAQVGWWSWWCSGKFLPRTWPYLLFCSQLGLLSLSRNHPFFPGVLDVRFHRVRIPGGAGECHQGDCRPCHQPETCWSWLGRVPLPEGQSVDINLLARTYSKIIVYMCITVHEYCHIVYLNMASIWSRK